MATLASFAGSVGLAGCQSGSSRRDASGDGTVGSNGGGDGSVVATGGRGGSDSGAVGGTDAVGNDGAAGSGAPRPVKIIFDSDMAPDVDDVGALAVLHHLADVGDVEILALGVSSQNSASAGVTDVVDTYYCRPNLPIGAYKGTRSYQSSSHYASQLVAKFPRDLASNAAAEDAVRLFRRTLAAQPDGSVVFVEVGPQLNLQTLLESAGDAASPLTGRELIAKKVRQLVVMGGRFPSGEEFNIQQDVASAVAVAQSWPTPIVYSGFEIGNPLLTGGPLASAATNSPVREGYRLFTAVVDGYGPYLRNSWDLTAVLFAAHGAADYWTLSPEGQMLINGRGGNSWSTTPKGHRYLRKKMSDAELTRRLDAMLVAAPRCTSSP